MRLIIAGGRNFSDFGLLVSEVTLFIGEFPPQEVEIISGTAVGADRLGERYAKSFGFPIKQFPANWQKFGRRAGYLRNLEMAKYATHLIAFWDGKSPGTEMMIELAKSHLLVVKIVIYA